MKNQPEALKNYPKNDSREYLRRNCYLPIIEHEQKTKPFGNVLNLSTSGLFVVAKEAKDQAEPLKARFFVPNVSGPINFLGKVVYVKSEGGGQFLGMGVRFLELDGEHKKTLRNYVLNHGFNETLSGFQKKSNSSVQNLKPFNDLGAIQSIFYSAARQQAAVQIFWCRHYISVMTLLQDVGKYHLSLKLPKNSDRDAVDRYDHLYLGMTHQGTSYFFEATVKYKGNDSLTITKPDTIYFEERRVETRYGNEPNGDDRTRVELQLTQDGGAPSVQQVADFNSSGLSFHIPLGDSYFSAGRVIHEINVIKNKKIDHHDSATVVHVTPVGRNQVKVGLEFHVEREPYEFKQTDPQIENTVEKYPGISRIVKMTTNILKVAESIYRRFLGLQDDVQLLKYSNEKGEKIVAIVNATFDITSTSGKRSTPVVIIPPAYARRKETTGLLAMVIVETFRKYKKDVVVIRFDGIRSIGESYNDQECAHDGKEMIHYTLTQLASDIGTTVDYAKRNPGFQPSSIVLISFSMASIAARRSILVNGQKDIDYWISCMGASDPDDLMKNSTGGIDYLMEFRQGEKLSVKQVLGHMVNLDNYCNDIESNDIAYLEDARKDMAKIKIPVTWIYGRYDYWINRNRILDIMSIKSKGPRQVREVPCGHIVKTSYEAIEVFKLIVQHIWEQLYHENVIPSVPAAAERAAFERAEWARIRQKEMDHKNYWRSYLLGQEKGEIGFDIITLTDEYHELMEKQLALLELKETDLLIDMGGGTGNFMQCYLESEKPKKTFGSERGPKIYTADFVKEALLRAREKHKRIIGADVFRRSGFGYVTADLNVVNPVLKLPFKDNSLDKILASLFISYVKNAQGTLEEFFRILKPDGMVVVSSLKPDTDMSKPIQSLIDKIKAADELPYFEGKTREELLTAVQYYINTAAYLTDLEEEKMFKFYNTEELTQLLIESGFRNIRSYDSFGSPAQAVIAIGFK